MEKYLPVLAACLLMSATVLFPLLIKHLGTRERKTLGDDHGGSIWSKLGTLALLMGYVIWRRFSQARSTWKRRLLYH